ncbi:efflux RND transporter permease subunit [Bowmanella dokdonensis]|uniref:Efflux RND transporter permease subunit n=1 Tax=Bowmanella dokdonensis TaxID=751969 RepID=A0A939IPM0_9ALTE|nr:CusA/CzcA family heavy metal efflux RND transporter [Bowmanella dokdonensis]MBN7824129.1 efflux RND transporter permease subunit [Bowmanella dokdonensis]
MLHKLIALSVRQRGLVLLLVMLLAGFGWQAMRELNVDAIPDLSDVQVIIKTPFAGQSPQLVEQQVTYPLANIMMAVPGARVVRGFSFYGDSYLYVLFEDGTDIYWARSRVLEYLNQARSQLPPQAQPELGPDASGVGWVYQYALKDTSGNWNLADLKSLQDWFLKQELQSVPGVAEVATVGGMTRTYQVVLNPLTLARYQLSAAQIIEAIRTHNGETGGASVEMGEAEYMLRVKGYLQSLDDFSAIPVGVRSATNIPLTLGEVARVQLGPELRRGIAELNGQGEVVGGIVVMRSGENAREVIQGVKNRLDELKASLPQGVEVVPTYDRSDFIDRSVDNLTEKLLLEMAIVSLVLLVFLWHLGSTLVAIIVLPLALLFSFLLMRTLDISANIMSLGGIAIAIGALVDAAIVMIENQHKILEQFQHRHGRRPGKEEHWQLVIQASQQVGPALFLTLLIITASFFPVFVLEGQEGRLFAPLALTKSFAMAGAALLAVTLVPVLMGYWVRGNILPEQKNLLSRGLIAIYRPLLRATLAFPKISLLLAAIVLASGAYPLLHLGKEFMPQIEEGDLLYMPTTLPGISAGKAAQLLQQTDRLIKQIPEVKRVFGKIGRAETATDPAPLTMLETTIQLYPREAWRDGMTMEKLIDELNQKVQIPGVTNAWVQPIKTRIDMLSTGIKTPLGLKISGPDLNEIQRIGQQVESILSQLPSTLSVYSERVAGGRYLDIQPNLQALGEYGISLMQLQELVRYAIGGAPIDQIVSGNERYPINVRFEARFREDLDALNNLPISTSAGVFVPLSALAELSILEGPGMIKSENARQVGWTFIDIQGLSIGEYLQQARVLLDKELSLPARYSVQWSGQYESLKRVEEKLWQLIPMTLVICLILLFLTLKSWSQSLVVMGSLPIALTGSLWLLWLLGFNLSIAVVVGMIALAGVAAEFGVVMYLYLNHAWQESGQKDRSGLLQATMEGAVQRIRPKAMTVITILASLLPIMLTQGTGHEVMQRIAAPMLGGMILAPLVSLFVIPVFFYMLEKRRVT